MILDSFLVPRSGPAWLLGALFLLMVFVAAATLRATPARAQGQTPVLAPRVRAETPHDPSSYVQGLVFYQGAFLESRGRYGESELRRVDPATGQVEAVQPLPENVFAEGLALANGRLYQLTWREGLVFVWNEADLAPLGRLMFMGQGWGAAYDGERLIVSDGSDTLRFFSPQSLSPQGALQITDQGEPVDQLNELEWIEGRLWANVWKTPFIAIIDPQSGRVEAWLDCTELCRRAGWVPGNRDLNGIAFDPATGRIWITGKLWDRVYEIEVEGE